MCNCYASLIIVNQIAIEGSYIMPHVSTLSGVSNEGQK